MSELESFNDYIDICINSNRMMFVVITSSAEGLIPSHGFKAGEGKSTLAIHISKNIYENHRSLVDSDELVKLNMGYNKESVRDMIIRGFDERVLCYIADDLQQWAGKHNSYSKNLRWFTGQLSTKRPYCAIFIATCPDLSELAKCFRDLFMFEVKVPFRGYCEIQQIKTKTDFSKPLDPHKRLHYISEAEFPPLSPEFEEWYLNWRDTENKEEFIKGWDERFGDETPKFKFQATRRELYDEYRNDGGRLDFNEYNRIFQSAEKTESRTRGTKEDPQPGVA